MKAIATIKLSIDIDEARSCGLEIEDSEVEEYAIDEMIEWVYEMARQNEIAECIHIEIESEEK